MMSRLDGSIAHVRPCRPPRPCAPPCRCPTPGRHHGGARVHGRLGAGPRRRITPWRGLARADDRHARSHSEVGRPVHEEQRRRVVQARQLWRIGRSAHHPQVPASPLARRVEADRLGPRALDVGGAHGHLQLAADASMNAANASFDVTWCPPRAAAAAAAGVAHVVQPRHASGNRQSGVVSSWWVVMPAHNIAQTREVRSPPPSPHSASRLPAPSDAHAQVGHRVRGLAQPAPLVADQNRDPTGRDTVFRPSPDHVPDIRLPRGVSATIVNPRCLSTPGHPATSRPAQTAPPATRPSTCGWPSGRADRTSSRPAAPRWRQRLRVAEDATDVVRVRERLQHHTSAGSSSGGSTEAASPVPAVAPAPGSRGGC